MGISVFPQTALSGQFTLCLEALNEKELIYYTGYSTVLLNTIMSMIELHLQKNPANICESLDFAKQIFMTLYVSTCSRIYTITHRNEKKIKEDAN